MKLFYLFTLALVSLPHSLAQAAERYVSDDLFIYLHSGPSTQYRIVGSVNAGSKVDVQQWNTETEFAKVIDPKGRTGWVETKFLGKESTAKTRLPIIEAELDKAKSVLANLDQKNSEVVAGKDHKIKAQSQQVKALMQDKKTLTEKIRKLEVQNAGLESRLETQDEEVQMQWLLRGGAVMGAGIFVGIIIPFLPRRKKKQSSW